MLVDDRGALVCVSGHSMTGLLGAPPSIASHVVSLFRYFHPGSDPLELDSRFWEIRDSIVQCELLVLRVLRFQVSFQHPHKVHVVGVGRRAAVTHVIGEGDVWEFCPLHNGLICVCAQTGF